MSKGDGFEFGYFFQSDKEGMIGVALISKGDKEDAREIVAVEIPDRHQAHGDIAFPILVDDVILTRKSITKQQEKGSLMQTLRLTLPDGYIIVKDNGHEQEDAS